MNHEDAESWAADLRLKKARLLANFDIVQTQRSNLPRSAKREAGILLAALNKISTTLRSIKLELSAAEGLAKRREQHGLWEQAVLNLYGEPGLASCRAQMRQIKMNRENPLPPTTKE